MSTWIKLLDSLHEDPRVFRMGDLLAKTAQLYILAPTTDLLGPVTNSVTRNALRDVTIAGLARVWRSANRLTTAGTFPHATLDYLDTLAQITGFGAAMDVVGYAKYDPETNTVTLPRFTEHNSPDKNGERKKIANAQRQTKHREKLKTAGQTLPPVTDPVTRDVTRDITRPITDSNEENNSISSLSLSLSKSTEGTPLHPESEHVVHASACSGSDQPPSTTANGSSATLQPPQTPAQRAEDPDPLGTLQKRINALRPAWAKAPHWGSEEEHALYEARHNLLALEDQDWLLLAWFFRWANSATNTCSKNPVAVTTRRHQFVTELSAYLDRSTTAWKQAGCPKLTGSTKPTPKPPARVQPEDEPTGPTDAFRSLCKDLNITRRDPVPSAVTTTPAAA